MNEVEKAIRSVSDFPLALNGTPMSARWSLRALALSLLDKKDADLEGVQVSMLPLKIAVMLDDGWTRNGQPLDELAKGVWVEATMRVAVLADTAERARFLASGDVLGPVRSERGDLVRLAPGRQPLPRENMSLVVSGKSDLVRPGPCPSLVRFGKSDLVTSGRGPSLVVEDRQPRGDGEDEYLDFDLSACYSRDGTTLQVVNSGPFVPIDTPRERAVRLLLAATGQR